MFLVSWTTINYRSPFLRSVMFVIGSLFQPEFDGRFLSWYLFDSMISLSN